MKQNEIDILLLCVFMLTVMSSCGLEAPDFVETKKSEEFQLSNTLTELLDAFDDELISTDTVNFIYPVELAYSNGIAVTVFTTDGMMELNTSQRRDLYIESIYFPFSLRVNNEQIEIDGEEQFDRVVTDILEAPVVDPVPIATIDRQGLIDAYGQCFTLEFPFSFVIPDASDVTFTNFLDFNNFIASNETYQPEFRFPVQAVSPIGTSPSTLNSIGELAAVANSCEPEPCLPPGFEVNQLSLREYEFIPPSTSLLYSWVIDGTIVSTGTGPLLWTYDDAGTYEVTVKIENQWLECYLFEYSENVVVQ